MKYAMIFGDELTKFEPIVFVYDDGKYEVICESAERQKHYYTHLASSKYPTFEDFIRTFSYFNVDSGEVNDDVESLLNKLRAKYMLEQIAQAEIDNAKQSNVQDNLYDGALLKISKRIRTGQNER